MKNITVVQSEQSERVSEMNSKDQPCISPKLKKEIIQHNQAA